MDKDPKILDVIYHQVLNWRRFGRLIGLEEHILDAFEADYKRNAERIERCMQHKRDASIKLIKWNYWKERLLRLKEGEGIVQELERNFPDLSDSIKEEDNEQGNKEQFIDIFDIISTTISDWKRLAKVLDVEYLSLEIEEHDKYNRLEEKVYRCIDEKITSPPDWFYWRDKILEYSSNVNKQNEKDLVEDIEMLYPFLLNDDRIDLSNACHITIDEFGIYAHHAYRSETLDCLPVTFKDRIKIDVGAGIELHKKLGDIVAMQDYYFRRLNTLQDIRKFDFSNLNQVQECHILNTQNAWLQANNDYGFTIKGYDAHEHLNLFSDHVNITAQTDSILTYSAKHNVILHINKAAEDIRFIKKTMRDNCFYIRALKTSNQCLDGQSFIYVPITLHDKDKNEVDAIVKCSTCVDSGLVVSSDEFKDLEHLEIWWKHLQTKLKSIRQRLKIQQTDKSNCLLKNILGYMALTSIYLPTFDEVPEGAIKEAQKLIMLTPEQRDIVYSDKKFKIIKGPYGSGKTVIAQEIIKLVAKEMGGNEIVFYLLHNSNSIYVREMVKLTKRLKNKNIVASKVSNFIKGTKTLSAILAHLLENNLGKIIHVVIEEFNGEFMDEEEVYKIKVLLQNKEYENSHIVLVTQSMENERFEIQDKNILPCEKKFKYDLLEQETGFELYVLSLLLRSTVEINTIIDVAIPILRSIISKFDITIDSKSTNLPERTHKPRCPSIDEIKYVEPSTVVRSEAGSSGSINDLSKEKESSTSIVRDIDTLFKHFSTNASKYRNQANIESRYKYVGEREVAHNVKGGMPSIYYPFSKDVNSIIICLNKDSLIILKDVLNNRKIKWIDDPDRFYVEDFAILLTEYSNVRGCEFLNVILIYPTDKIHVKHNMVDCLCRCKMYLADDYDPDKTLLQILEEWKNNELVQIYEKDYLKNADKLELQKFQLQHLLKIDKPRQIVHERRAGFESNLYSKSQQDFRSLNTNPPQQQQGTRNYVNLDEIEAKSNEATSIFLLKAAAKIGDDWIRFGNLAGFDINNIKADKIGVHKKAHKLLCQMRAESKKPLKWCNIKDILVSMKKNDAIRSLEKEIISIQERYGKHAFFNIVESNIDKSSSQFFKWRIFGRLVGILEDDLDQIEYTYTNNYDRVYHCIKLCSFDEKNIDWAHWREMLLTLSDGGEIVDIIEIRFIRELNLAVNSNRVHMCVNKVKKLAILAHNANLDDNLNLLPFELTEQCFAEDNKDIYGVLDKRKLANCGILETFQLWLKNINDTGFAVKGYDAKKHLESLTVDYKNKNSYKDSYVLVFSVKHGVIFLIDTDPTDDINTAIRNNRANVRYLLTLHRCLIGKDLTFVPVLLYNDSIIQRSQEVCDNCINLQLIVSRHDFQQLYLLEKWWENVETNIERIAKLLRKQNQSNDIANTVLNSINSFMCTLYQ